MQRVSLGTSVEPDFPTLLSPFKLPVLRFLSIFYVTSSALSPQKPNLITSPCLDSLAQVSQFWSDHFLTFPCIPHVSVSRASSGWTHHVKFIPFHPHPFFSEATCPEEVKSGVPLVRQYEPAPRLGPAVPLLCSVISSLPLMYVSQSCCFFPRWGKKRARQLGSVGEFAPIH